MTNKKKSQKQLILEHMQSGKSISPIEALNLYGCFRLASAIHKLVHEDGVKISVDNTEKYAVYSLAK